MKQIKGKTSMLLPNKKKIVSKVLLGFVWLLENTSPESTLNAGKWGEHSLLLSAFLWSLKQKQSYKHVCL